MPIYKGTNNIVAIYKGTNLIGSVYKGTTLVYQKEVLPSGFIKPRTVYENEAFNLVYDTCTTDIASIWSDTTSGKWKIGYFTGSSVTASDAEKYYNGVISATEDTSTQIFYLPSYHNNQDVIGVANFAFYYFRNVYPNLTDLVIGEGIEKIGMRAIRYDGTSGTGPSIDNLPRLVLPKSMKTLFKGAIYKFHLPEVKLSNYNYYNQGYTDESSINARGSRFTACYINHIIADKASQISVDWNNGTNDGDFNAISGGLSANKYDLLEIKDVTRIGNYCFKYVHGPKVIIYGEVQEIGTGAFSTTNTSDLFTDIVFKHTDNQTLTMSLDSSNRGPFYYKNARAVNIYTDNTSIKNHDWSGAENITATFYHLDGTAWS